MHVTRLQVCAVGVASVLIGTASAYRSEWLGQDADVTAFRAAESAAMARASAAFTELSMGMPGYELVCAPLTPPASAGQVEGWQVECWAPSRVVRGAFTMSGPTARPDCISWSDQAPATPGAREALRLGGPTRAAWHWICVTGFAEPGDVWRHVRTADATADDSAVRFRSGSRRLLVLLNRRTGGLRQIVASQAPQVPPRVR